MKSCLILLFLLLNAVCYSQIRKSPLGTVTQQELQMTSYLPDTTASAVVLNEFAKAYFENDTYNLLFEHHIKIKILKKEGTDKGNYSIVFPKYYSEVDNLRDIEASAFNLDEQGEVVESKLDKKNVFVQNVSGSWGSVKFAIPSVKVGTVIYVSYTLKSSFYYNFKSFKFQSDIPKIYSEYWAYIPGNLKYNISLQGFLKLDKNEVSIVPNCLSLAGGRAGCDLFKYAMKDVPAFREEEYMTAASNFISSVNFELREFMTYYGGKRKITEEWKHVEKILLKSEEFGIQIRKGENFIDNYIKPLIANETNEVHKAEKIYHYIRSRFEWNKVFGFESYTGIKKAFETRTGNIGDINLCLIAALRAADLNVEPVILSTRNNGTVTELYPVLSEFNYVVAKLNVGEKVYLLDATDHYLPFGLIHERCINGKGRVLGEENSYWFDLKPSQKAKLHTTYDLEIQNNTISGTIKFTRLGYEATTHRKKISSYNSMDEYMKSISSSYPNVNILKHELKNLEEVDLALTETLTVEFTGDMVSNNSIIFTPFIFKTFERNPFIEKNRLFPIDFGSAYEYTTTIKLKYADGYQIAEVPENVGLRLPNEGGRLVLNTEGANNMLTLNYAFAITRGVFAANEYQHLREIFNKALTLQNHPILVKKI